METSLEHLSCLGAGNRLCRAPGDDLPVDDQRFGSAVRSVRQRRRLRQLDVAIAAGVSRSTISRIERGHVGTFSVDALRAVGRVLDIRVELVGRWRAGDLDRLLNARHSDLHELVSRRFRGLPEWIAQPEVSFAIYGERGVIDILAWHPRRRALLVIELKTDIADVNELIGTIDRKERLAEKIAIERGWIRPGEGPPAVSVWVIVAEGHTNRRRVQAHASLLRSAFPADGRAIAGWLSDPVRTIRALSFWPDVRGQNVGRGSTPIRRVGVTSLGRCERRPSVNRRTGAGR